MSEPFMEFLDIDKLPIVDEIIVGIENDSREIYELLSQAQQTPHLLDDETVDRAERMISERLQILAHDDEQLQRWQDLAIETKLSVAARIKTLRAVVTSSRVICEKTTALIKELRSGTINRIMEMDDAALGAAVLSGQIPRLERVKLKTKQVRLASRIDKAAKKLMDQEADAAKFLGDMFPHMPDFKFLMETAKPAQFDEMCRRYEGFFCYARLLEDLSEGIASGDIVVP